jgi:uncharacterized repeat protein (TIGR01451 family)
MKKTFVAVLLAAFMLAVLGVTMILAAPAAVGVTKTVSTLTAFPGDLITYTIVITNDATANFALVDNTPTNTTYVNHTVQPIGTTGHYAGGGTVVVPTGTVSLPGDFIWYVPTSGTLGAGDRVTVTLTVLVNAGVRAGTVITNAADYYVGTSPKASSNTVSTTVWGRTYLPIMFRF